MSIEAQGKMTESTPTTKENGVNHRLGRRAFIKTGLTTLGSLILAACGVDATKTPTPESPTSTPTKEPEANKEIQFGEYPCSVEGAKNGKREIELLKKALGDDFVPGMETAFIPFRATYTLNDDFFNPETSTGEFIAVKPMDILDADGGVTHTEDQLWFKESVTGDDGEASLQYRRLGYVDIKFENTGKKTIAWVRTDEDLRLHDKGLVPEAKEVIKTGDWLMMAVSKDTLVMRPPQEALEDRPEWGPLSSCVVTNKPTDILTPTPDAPDGVAVRFATVSEVSLRIAPTATIEAPEPEKPPIQFCELKSVKSLQDIKDACTITVDQLADIDASLQKLSRPFDPDQINQTVPIINQGLFLTYGNTRNNYKTEEEKPFRRELAAYFTIKYEAWGSEQEMEFLVLPIEIPDPDNPGKTLWIKGVVYHPQGWENLGGFTKILNLWMHNDSPGIIGNEYFSGINSNQGVKNPITEPTFRKYDIQKIFAEAQEIDTMAGLTEPDMFLEVAIFKK